MDDARIARIREQVYYRVDGDKPFEAVSRDDTGWVRLVDKAYEPGAGPSRIWARFEMPAASSPGRVLVNNYIWERVEYYIVRDGKLVDRQMRGTLASRSNGSTLILSNDIPIDAGFISIEQLPESRVTVFARLESDFRFSPVAGLSFFTWDPEKVRVSERSGMGVRAFFIGSLTVLILYNLGVFALVREASYPYYAMHLLGGLAIIGLPFLHIFAWPSHPSWTYYFPFIANPLSVVGHFQFTRHFLDTRTHYRRIDWLLNALTAIFVVAATLPLFDYSIAHHPIFDMLGIVPISVVLAIAIVSLVRRHPWGRYFFAGTLSFAIGIFVTIAAGMGLFPQSAFTEIGVWLGGTLEGVLLSIGLGVRMREERTRLARLKRFLSPKVSELIAAGQLDDPLATRRREVTIVFVDLRGFTAFSETAEPEDVLGVLRAFHAEVGRLVERHQGTIEHFAGDAVMVIFNDPMPLPDAALAAVSFGVELRDRVLQLAESWQKLGHGVGAGIGIAQGYATIGTIGFEGRKDYGVIGAVCNLSARLCAQAAAGQVLVSQRVHARVEGKVVAELVGELTLKGIQAPVPAYNVLAMKMPNAAMVGTATEVAARS